MPRDPLEPAYRLIASNRYTEAIHIINKLLKKQPNFQIAKVWKCEALYGLGNVTESEELMSTIIGGAAADKRTLECVADFYRARGNYEKLVEVYDNALKFDPSDESWRKALFECCGLAGDFKKQQQQALILYKQSPRMLFYCMAVVCLLQQADENPVALELAERMMSKQADAGKLKSKNEVLLWLTVLERRKKYGEALSLVEKSAAELDSLISTIDKQIELYVLLECWQKAMILLKQYLKDKPDSWFHYETYLKTVLRLKAAADVNPIEEDPIVCAEEFLRSQHQSHPSLRGPLLAQIELSKLLINEGGHPSHCENVSALVLKYFELFGEKGISLFDLKKYIPLLHDLDASNLLQKLSSSSWPNTNLVELQQRMGTAKHVSFVLLSRMLSAHAKLSVEERIVLSDELELCYKNAEEMERRDHYLILLANVRLSLYDETGNGSHLVNAVCVLEEASSQGYGIFALQVLLLQLYFALGASRAAKKIYEQMRIQSVQVDTLAHMFLIGISSTGHFSTSLEMWETALKILNQCAAESLEALVWSYRSGIFHRVSELTRCARRFQRSLTVPWLRGEKSFLELIVAEPSRSEQVLGKGRIFVDWDSCVDNRDLQALPTWDPPEQKPNSVESFREMLLFSRLREATMSNVAAAVVYGKDRKEEDGEKFAMSLQELRRIYSEASLQNGVEENKKTAKTYTRLHLLIGIPLPALFEKLLDLDQSSFEKVCTILNQISDNFVHMVETHRTKDPRKCLESAVTQIEVLSLATLVVGAARAGLSAANIRRSEPVVRCLEKCWAQLESSLNFPIPPCSYPNSVTRETVETKLRDNYQVAIDDMKKVVRKKASYLHKLKSP